MYHPALQLVEWVVGAVIISLVISKETTAVESADVRVDKSDHFLPAYQ